MKINKKLLVVPFLSTVVGLSLAGGIGGAFAWYQFNSQVTASFVGSSVADTTLLQIASTRSGAGTTESPYTYNWGKSFYKTGTYNNTNKFKLIPVTFGQLVTKNGKSNCIPNAYAYGYPEAGGQAGNGYENWQHINPNEGFVQFDIYLRALKADKTQIDLDVYLSDITIEAVMADENQTSEADANKDVSKTVRVHLDVSGTEADCPNRLISKETVTDLPLYGKLDLDGDGEPDKTKGYGWENPSVITYGTPGDTQTTTSIENTVQARDANGLMPSTANGKRICRTLTGNGAIKITVTTWLEGWATYLTGDDDDPATTDIDESVTSVWDPTKTSGIDIRVGLTFDTGKIRI